MTREEFCLNLSDLRKSLNIGLQTMAILSKTGVNVILRVDKGKNNFNLKTLLLYLNAINYDMFVGGVRISSGEEFAKFIKDLRVGNKISHEKFGKIVGMKKLSIVLLEHSDANPRIDTILNISNAFNLRVKLREREG